MTRRRITICCWIGILLCTCFLGLQSSSVGVVFALSSSSTVPLRRPLPEKILVGYATHCSDKVLQSVRDGVNVVIWSFVEMVERTEKKHNNPAQSQARCVSSFDIHCAQQMIRQLDQEGYTDTIHLVSFGGWNGPHLPDALTTKKMYQAWKEHIGGEDTLFHGVDWDLEGHDRLDHPNNEFSIKCLEAMGQFSELAKRDGFLVGMAPPQSYFDIETNHFSRFVNWKDHRQWHDDFSYFGRNVYAYLLSKYGQSIDFVSVQFYESYSRAGWEVFGQQMPPQAYLQHYVQRLVEHHQESFFVNFEEDPSLDYNSRDVQFPLSKLVFGFANGWGFNDDDKVCYFDPNEIDIAYKALLKSNQTPRGFMFWVM